MPRSKPTAAPKRPVVAFKVSRSQNMSKAWCAALGCRWHTTWGDPVKARRLGKRHCEDTGHEVRIDTQSQRGYRPKE